MVKPLTTAISRSAKMISRDKIVCLFCSKLKQEIGLSKRSADSTHASLFYPDFPKILYGFRPISGICPNFLTGFCLSRFCLLLKRFPFGLVGQVRGRAVRTFVVLVRRSLVSPETLNFKQFELNVSRVI